MNSGNRDNIFAWTFVQFEVYYATLLLKIKYVKSETYF